MQIIFPFRTYNPETSTTACPPSVASAREMRGRIENAVAFMGKGLALKFGMTKLRISQRNGGESFKPNVLRPTRTLKHLLQEANIPPWQRDHLPLIYWHDTLAFVPGIGTSHELQASENEPGLEIIWQPDTPA